MNGRCNTLNAIKGEAMPTEKQRSAARKNIKKAASAAKKKRTIAHLPKSTRTALGRQGAKVAKQKRQKKAA
jgi:ABC-type transport system involved in Fe-S cluster assembly fused permease/ATPase subunit